MIASTLPLELLNGSRQALLPITSPPPLPQMSISWALLPLQFTAQSRVNRDTLHQLQPPLVGWAAQAAQSSIKAGPPERSRMLAPTANHLYWPFLGVLLRRGPCPLLHWPPKQVPVGLADGGRIAYDTLHTMKKETSLLPWEGGTHSSFCHDPWVISMSPASTVTLGVREGQTL